MKNGFTLVEILATLAILSIVAIVVTINIPKNVEKAEKEELQSFAEKAEKAACTYIELNAYSERKKNCRNNASTVKSDCKSQCNKKYPLTERQECKSNCENSSNYYFCDISLAELKIAGLLSKDDIDEYAAYIEKNEIKIEDNRLYQLANNNPTSEEEEKKLDELLKTQLKTNTGLPDSDFQELKKMLNPDFKKYEGQTVEVLWVNNAKTCYFVPAVADDLLD